jgi:hypothetical protein
MHGKCRGTDVSSYVKTVHNALENVSDVKNVLSVKITEITAVGDPPR